MCITIITSPFCELPPDAIGAVERRWANTAMEFSGHGNVVVVIGKRGKTILESSENLRWEYVRGYARTRTIYCDIILDFLYSFRALRKLQKCDVLVCNTFWTPILAPLFFRCKFKKLAYNVARFPKKHLRFYKQVDYFFCTSKAVKSALLSIMDVSDRVFVVSNPINVKIYNTDVSPDDHGVIRIGYHGRINREKGLDILARAVSIVAGQVSDVKLRMIGPWAVKKGGSGLDYRQRIESLAKGCEVEWIDAISDPMTLASSLRECTLYCYPSVAERGETFGVSPLEAMGLGLPTIVSKLECFEDFLEAGRNGLVFDHRSSHPEEALAQKILYLLNNADVRRRLANNAAEEAKGFSTAEIAVRYLRILGA